MRSNIRILVALLLVACSTAARRRRSKAPTPALKQLEIKSKSIYLEPIPDDKYDTYMSNFHLDTIHTLAVNPKDQMEYNFDFDYTDKAKNAFVWLSYVLRGEASLEFAIMDRENNTVLYSTTNTNQMLAKIYFRNSQKIKFIFRNTAFNTYARIAAGFECHNCKAASSYAVADDVKESVKSIKEINYLKTRMQFVSDVYKEKQESYLKNLSRSHSKLLFFSVLEVFGVVLINIVQIYVIKNLVSHKRVI